MKTHSYFAQWVRDALSDLITFEDEKKEWQALRKKMENARDEIEKAEETISQLNEEMSELEHRKKEIESEIKQYNEDMLKITTFNRLMRSTAYTKHLPILWITWTRLIQRKQSSGMPGISWGNWCNTLIASAYPMN